MKIIIAGSRHLHHQDAAELILEAFKATGWVATQIVSGGAPGADAAGEQWAKDNGVPCKRFLPDWKLHGFAGGPIRNRQMAAYADALMALWDGKSRGTKNMIEEAAKRGLKVHVSPAE